MVCAYTIYAGMFEHVCEMQKKKKTYMSVEYIWFQFNHNSKNQSCNNIQ